MAAVKYEAVERKTHSEWIQMLESGDPASVAKALMI